MNIKIIKNLNYGQIKIKPITFWQALGLSFMFDLVLMVVSGVTDISLVGLTFISVIEPNVFNNLYDIFSTLLSFIYQYGTILIIVVFINKSLNLSNKYDERISITKKDYIFAAMLIISYICITYGWFDSILFSIPSPNMDSMVEYLDSIPIWILIVESCVLAPIFEELLYRGILLNGMLNKYNPKKAIFYSAIIFGIAHLNIPQGINAFFLALLLGMVYYYTKSLYICMFMHFTNNLLVNFVLYPSSRFWTILLYILIPIIGVVLMILSIKILNFRDRKNSEKSYYN